MPKTHMIYLGLGSNVSNRMGNLDAAIKALAPDVNVVARSPIYETEPWGYEDQDHFLNMVVQAETALEPRALRVFVKEVEDEVGRKKTFRYGPREIDIDILLYDDLVMESPDLSIPHAHMHERAFVLVPLADLAPELLHPTLKKSVTQLLAEVSVEGIRKYKPGNDS